AVRRALSRRAQARGGSGGRGAVHRRDHADADLMHALLAALVLAAAADARPAKKPSRDPRTVGLGKTCKKNKDCKHASQRCVSQSDSQGKAIGNAFCVLPCASFEAGMPKVTPGMPAEPSQQKKK